MSADFLYFLEKNRRMSISLKWNEFENSKNKTSFDKLSLQTTECERLKANVTVNRPILFFPN